LKPGICARILCLQPCDDNVRDETLKNIREALQIIDMGAADPNLPYEQCVNNVNTLFSHCLEVRGCCMASKKYGEPRPQSMS
jgi:hypothetical protein